MTLPVLLRAARFAVLATRTSRRGIHRAELVMTVTTLTGAEGVRLSVQTLGLDPDSVALDSSEGWRHRCFRGVVPCSTSPSTWLLPP